MGIRLPGKELSHRIQGLGQDRIVSFVTPKGQCIACKGGDPGKRAILNEITVNVGMGRHVRSPDLSMLGIDWIGIA
jgi:hypothetical protein